MKLILATDGSGHAELAETFISRFPIAKSMDLDVVGVCSMLPILGVGVPAIAEPVAPAQATELWEELHKHTQKTIDQAADRLTAAAFHPNRVILDGDIAGELIDYAERSQANLVVSGSRGENALVAMLLGSTARKLVSHCKCSVLIVHTYKDKTVEESAAMLKAKPKLTALLAVDDSDGAQAAVKAFKAIGNGFERIVCLSVRPLPVFPPTVVPMIAAMEVYSPDDMAQSIADAACAELQGCADKVEALRAHGHPSHEIVSVAEDIGADLVVVGATRHGIIERFLIGSVAYDVAANSPCSVLVVRP